MTPRRSPRRASRRSDKVDGPLTSGTRHQSAPDEPQHSPEQVNILTNDSAANPQTGSSNKFSDLMSKSRSAAASLPSTPPTQRNAQNDHRMSLENTEQDSPDPLQCSYVSRPTAESSGARTVTRATSTSPLRRQPSVQHRLNALSRPAGTRNKVMDTTSEAESPDPMRIEVVRPRRAPAKTYGKGFQRATKPVAMPLSDISADRSSPRRSPTRQTSQLGDNNGNSVSPSKRRRTPPKDLIGTSSPWHRTTEDVLSSTTSKAFAGTPEAASPSPSPTDKSRAFRSSRTSPAKNLTEEESEDDDVDEARGSDSNEGWGPTASPCKKTKSRASFTRRLQTMPTNKSLAGNGQYSLDSASIGTLRHGRASLSKTSTPLEPEQSSLGESLAVPASSQDSVLPASWASRLDLSSGPPKSSAESWSLARMDKLVWILVGGRFWWPGDITSALRSERPLVVQLLKDPTGVTDGFDAKNFLQSDDVDGQEALESAFKDVLRQAIALERSRDLDDEEEDGSPGNIDAGPSAFSQSLGNDEDEALLQDATNHLSCPSYVLAKSMRQWWPARLDKLVDKDNAEDDEEKAQVGNYAVTWFDWTTDYVSRKDILPPSTGMFHRVKVGKTAYERSQFHNELSGFVANHTDRWQKIIDENFAFAQRWNDAFYGGGRERDGLATEARFGELNEEHIDSLLQAILQWAEPKDERPRGSVRYEQLRNVERSRYRNDVLLPLVALGFLSNEFDDIQDAEHELKQKHPEQEVSDDSVVNRAYELTRDRLTEASILKTG
ncbi:hypothetical protein OIV83_001890 [Microbotryomycetes sp. JL201]|nr:hypothetical protein OIV83_001890 [Microbotryomycetes sp. JL201]